MTLSANGKQVAQKRIARTTANVFSLDEGADVGIDEDTPVTEDYQAGAKSRFSGKIDRVTVDVKEMTVRGQSLCAESGGGSCREGGSARLRPRAAGIWRPVPKGQQCGTFAVERELVPGESEPESVKYRHGQFIPSTGTPPALAGLTPHPSGSVWSKATAAGHTLSLGERVPEA